MNAAIVLEAKNCLPAVNGFRPLRSLAAATSYMGEDYLTDGSGALISDASGLYLTSGAAVTSTCLGAAVVYNDDGTVFTYGGTETDLFELSALSQWLPVSRTSGGAYATGGGERWQFGFSGGLVIAVTIGEEPQKFLLGSSTNFEALGGTPPKARYIATIGEFVVLGGLDGDERTVHWSGLGNPEHWTPGTQSCDTQTFQNGGPVRGIVGGEVGYIFQAEAVTRMTFVPGSEAIFQFDQVEGGRGLAAPYSLVKIGADAYYFAPDGFYRFGLAGGASTPIGVGKWVREFMADIKPGTESTVIGGVDPVNKIIVWAYNSATALDTDLDKILIYDWTLDEATIAEVAVTAMAQSLTQGLTLDTIDSFGTSDELPFSLDSPVWRGGAALLGMFGSDSRLSYFAGNNMAATFETADGGAAARTVIKGVRPHIDTRSVSAAIAAREAEGDAVAFGADESMADTGVIPAWASGFLARARLTVAEEAVWTKITGADAVVGKIGNR